MRPSPPGSVVTFFVLAYAASWLVFFIPAAVIPSPTLTPVQYGLVTLGAFMPSLVAIALTRLREGDAAVRALVGRTLRWRVAARWYLFAAGYFAAVKLAAAAVHRVWAGTWPRV